MNTDRNDLTEMLTLTLIDKKQTVESSYFFHQLYTRLGIFEPINSIIRGLVDKTYITHDGDFGENSGLIKNIKITDQGTHYLERTLTEKAISKMEIEFDNFATVKEAVQSELKKFEKI